MSQKFLIKWDIAGKDSDIEGGFVLEVNDTTLSSFLYLSPSFKMVDQDLTFFDACLSINDKEVIDCNGHFEWRAGTLFHKITKSLDDQPAKSVKMTHINHSSFVTSEAISVL